MKIYLDINNQKVQSDNKSEPNFYLLSFKNIEIKDEFQEFNFKIVNNIEIKLNIKVKNKFNSEKVGDLFKKFQDNKKEEVAQPKSIIGTGVNMKERLALFSSNKKDETSKNTSNNYVPKKLKLPSNLAGINEKKKEEIKEVKKNEIKEEKNENVKNDKKEENKKIVNNEIKEEKINRNIESQNENNKTKEKKENDENNKKEVKKENEMKKEDNLEQIKKRDENIKKDEKNEVGKKIEKNEGKLEEIKEEIKEENKEEIKEEKHEVKKEEEEEKNIKENIYSGKEEETPNININMEIKVKDEEKKFINPIEQEKNIITKNFDKRTSNKIKFINPLTKIDESEETEQIITRKRGQAFSNLSPKNNEIKKSESILEKSNKLQLLLNKKSSEIKEKKENTENTNQENNKNIDFSKRNISLNIEISTKNSKKKIEEDLGINTPSNLNEKEKEDNDDYSLRTVSTELSSCKSIVPEVLLDSISYQKYSEQLKSQGKKEHEKERESFCEAFFLASFPYKNGQVIENSNIFPALCNHPDCNKLNAMKPEILLRYPLEDTKNLELNNLAATICFPTGIKVCYSQEEPPKGVKDYITNITNQKGERYYMMTYHFYLKMMNSEFTKKYEMHPLKHNLMKFGDAYLTFSEQEFTNEIVDKVQKVLEFCADLGFREYVYVPFCICLISKYPYSFEMEKSLQSIFEIFSEKQNILDFEINDLIMYLINSVPIPEKNSIVKFYLPYWNKDISLKCTTINGLNIMNIDFAKLTHIFSLNNIIIIFRLLLSEKKILFIDDDYTLLSKVTDAFISLLYPFNWIHTYIPIMSEQMLKYLESFLPFLNGIHSSLMPLVKNIFNEGEIDETEEVFLVYIKENNIQIGSSLKNKKIKMSKYIQNNVFALPPSVEKELKKKLSFVQDKYEIYQKNIKKKNNIDINQLDFKFRDAFIDVFVYFFHDYQKYIGLLEDDEVIFNKNLFIQTVKKEDKVFYEKFLETQLFEQFTQNILNADINYFNKKISLFGKKEKNKDMISISTNLFSLEKNYIVKPDFLNLKEDDNTITLEKTLTEKFKVDLKTNENGIILPSERIITDLKDISNDKYNKEKCLIYLLPEKKDNNQNNKQEKEQEIEPEDYRSQFLKKINAKRIFPSFPGNSRRKQTYINATAREGDLSDKKKELLKDEIKEWVIKIFKSEVEDIQEKPKIKTDVLSLINNPFGIKCFVDLISHNNQNATLLQKSSFRLLGFIIYNALLFLLNKEETSQVLEECVLLFKSTKNFCIQRNGQNKTLMDSANFKSNLMKYNKIHQKNFWKKWYDIELKEKQNMKKKENEENEEGDIDEEDFLKQKTLFSVCSNMIELEIPKTTIKNICDEINDIVFGKTTELGKQTSKAYINNITSAKYISNITI